MQSSLFFVMQQIKKKRTRQSRTDGVFPVTRQFFEASETQAHDVEKTNKAIFRYAHGKFVYLISGLYSFFVWSGSTSKHKHAYTHLQTGKKGINTACVHHEDSIINMNIENRIIVFWHFLGRPALNSTSQLSLIHLSLLFYYKHHNYYNHLKNS